MSNEQKPGDPADKAADGAFGGVQSHRAGYGDDKLARLIGWLRSYPHATLASGEGALLLAENDRLREERDALLAWKAENQRAIVEVVVDLLAAGVVPKGSISLRDGVNGAIAALDTMRQRAERFDRILAALREPSANVIESANLALPFAAPMIRAAVAAAEQEVGRE
jgi:hypothetical protein